VRATQHHNNKKGRKIFKKRGEVAQTKGQAALASPAAHPLATGTEKDKQDRVFPDTLQWWRG